MWKKIRKGNDIGIEWSLVDEDNTPYNLEGRNVTVEITSGNLKTFRIDDVLAVQNTLMFTYWGKDQRFNGVCGLKFIENDGEKGMVTFDIPNAFELTEHSWLTADEPENDKVKLSIVSLASTLLEKVGPKGDKGDAAGFGEVTAEIDAEIGTPSVSVETSGPDTAKNFHFSFHNLKGRDAEVTRQAIIAALGYTPANDESVIKITDAIKAVPVEAGSGQNSNQQKGTGAVASGKNSFATGNSTTASGNNSVSEGHSTIASGAASHAEGKETVASGQRSHAEGEQTLAGQKAYRYVGLAEEGENGLIFEENPVGFIAGDVVSIINDKKYADCATIKGVYNYSYGRWIVEFDNELPFDTIVPDSDFDKNLIYVSAKPDVGDIDLGRFAHAEGWGSKAQNVAAHAEGRDTKAYGEYSHAEGRNTLAQYAAHAEGKDTQALGERSHAEGHQSMASGGNAHAEGSTTTASGDNSHAEGASAVAGGDNSHAEGSETVTQNVAEHAEGKYNKSNKASDTFGDSSNTLHSVGIGAAEHLRKNAHEIMQNGDHYVYGVGGYDGTNPESANTLQQILAAKYTKPASGIPASDLASGVQTSLALAKSALQPGQTVEVTQENPYIRITITEDTGTVIFSSDNRLLLVQKYGSRDYVAVDLYGTSSAGVLLGRDQSFYVAGGNTNHVLFRNCTGTVASSPVPAGQFFIRIIQKVTAISNRSTDYEYPSAKAVYNALPTALSTSEIDTIWDNA